MPIVPDLIIYIRNDPDAGYSHDPPVVQRGQNVQFVMDGRDDTVEVHFDDGSPLTDTVPFSLNGASMTMSSQMTSVDTSATERTYTFYAMPPEAYRRWRKGIDPSPPGTVSGDIDVGSEPPRDPDDEDEDEDGDGR